MEKTKIIEIANKLLEYIATLPAGTEISTSGAIAAVYGKCYNENNECVIEGETLDSYALIPIDYAVHDNAKQYGIRLDGSKYAGMVLGLPCNIGSDILYIRDNQWWVDNLAPLLAGSKFEVKINPTAGEDCVIVVLKEEFKEHKKKKDHFLAVKPYKRGGFAAWMKMEVYDAAKHAVELPEPKRIHSNMPHFTNLSNEDMIFRTVNELAKIV